MRYDGITLGHGTVQFGGGHTHARVYVQSGSISVSNLPEHVSTIGYYLDKLFQQSPEAETFMHAQGYDDAAWLRGPHYRKRAKTIKNRNVVSPPLIGPAFVLCAKVNRTKRCEQSASKRWPIGPSGT